MKTHNAITVILVRSKWGRSRLHTHIHIHTYMPCYFISSSYFLTFPIFLHFFLLFALFTFILLLPSAYSPLRRSFLDNKLIFAGSIHNKGSPTARRRQALMAHRKGKKESKRKRKSRMEKKTK